MIIFDATLGRFSMLVTYHDSSVPTHLSSDGPGEAAFDVGRFCFMFEDKVRFKARSVAK